MIRFRRGDKAALGGLDINISLTPQEAEALQGETHELADWFDSVLYALALLRTGRSTRTPLRTNAAGHPERDITLSDLQILIKDLDQSLSPRLQGVRDAVIRLHHQSGGSINALATAMDVSKSTAQSRRNAVISKQFSTWEKWAVTGGWQTRQYCQSCGWPGTPSNVLGTTEEGYLIHTSHTQDPENGFHGAELVYEDSTSDTN